MDQPADLRGQVADSRSAGEPFRHGGNGSTLEVVDLMEWEIDALGFFQSYVATYLERDLRAQLQVGNLRDFERFLRHAPSHDFQTKKIAGAADLDFEDGHAAAGPGERELVAFA